jgi:hypothetical protein
MAKQKRLLRQAEQRLAVYVCGYRFCPVRDYLVTSVMGNDNVSDGRYLGEPLRIGPWADTAT